MRVDGILQIAVQLMESVAKDPDCLKQFGVDPAEAIKGATGLELSDEEVADVVKVVEPLLEGKELDMGAVMETVGDFLGDNPSDLLGKLGGLFGGK